MDPYIIDNIEGLLLYQKERFEKYKK